MVRNGPQTLDGNDAMVNARGLPGGDVEDSNRPFPSFPGPLFQNCFQNQWRMEVHFSNAVEFSGGTPF